MSTMTEDIAELALFDSPLTPAQELCTILDELVAEKGFHYRYPESRETYYSDTIFNPEVKYIDPKLNDLDDANPPMGCHYVDRSDEVGKPIFTYSCVVGGVVAKLAPENLELICTNGDNTDGVDIVMSYLPPRFRTEEIQDVLYDLQLRQDGSWPWGSAVRIAKHELQKLVP